MSRFRREGRLGEAPKIPQENATIRLGQIALERGLLTPEQLRDALAEQAREITGGRKKPRPLGNILVSKGYLTAEQLVPLLELQKAIEPAAGANVPSHAPLGKYSILKELGRGGMGVVYEAVDTQLHRRVALKMLLTSRNADPKETKLEEERFLREARLSASLPKHPHVVSVYEAGVLEEKQYIAMEYIDGQALSTWRKAGSVTIRQQAKLLRDVALAVHHAHQHGVIHRDLKPENILIDAKNEPHITDFGLAKTVGQDVSLSLTASGMIMGTPSYMSPEQAQGPKGTDHRTDIYSLGVLLYETLTGRLPFTGETAIEILMKASRSPVPPPSTVVRPGANPTLDQTIENICLKALAKNPRDRYATAEVFAGDLTRWLKGEEVRVVPPTARKLYQTPKSRAPWMLAAVAAAVVIAGVVAMGLRPAGSEPEDSTKGRTQIDRLFRDGKYEDVLPIAEYIKSSDPEKAKSLREEVRWKMKSAADDLFDAKKYGEAEALYGRLLARFPGDVPATKGKEAARRKSEEKATGNAPTRAAPVSDDWIRSIAAKPPEDQVRQVLARLKQLNPGFEEKEATHKVDGDRVVELSLMSPALKDLSPVRALTGLEILRAEGTPDSSTRRKSIAPLSDLSPLKNLRLKELGISFTRVQDLWPIKDMPLVALYFMTTPIRDLTPLKKMPLEELYCADTPISDLSPIAELPIKILYMNSTQVRDLSALRRLPLIKLGCSYTEVGDLTPLKDMRLCHLDVEHTRVADLSPVKGMPIQKLHCDETQVTDLSPIRGMPLGVLECDFNPERDAALLRSITTLERINGLPVAEFWKKHGASATSPEDEFVLNVASLPPEEQVRRVVRRMKELNPEFDGKEAHQLKDGQVIELSISAIGVTNLSPIRALSKLEKLECAGYWNASKGEGKIGEFADLSSLKGLRLWGLNVPRTKVRDLAPLEGMPLRTLNCMDTLIEDLSPLKQMPLTHLECYNTPVSDLSPLKGMKLEWLNIDSTKVSDLTPISGMPLAGVLLYKTRVTDLTPLKTIPYLKFLECDYTPARDREILKSIKTLEKINELPVAEFWKKQGEK